MSLTNAKKQTKSKLLALFSLLFVMIISLFTFSACKLFNDEEPSTNATYDSSGRLRLASPVVTFNPYSLEGNSIDSAHIIDENSGSFTWPLSYYYTSGTDIEHDQIYYKTNFYTVDVFSSSFNGDKSDYIFKYYLNYASGASEQKVLPIYTNKKEEIIAHYSLGSEDSVAWPNGSGDLDSTPHFYGFKEATGTETENSIIRLYTGFDEVAQKYKTSKSVLQFPDYEVVVDGRYYTFRVVLDSGVTFDMPSETEDNLLTNPLSTTSESVFKFYYRNGMASTAGAGLTGFTECPKDYMTYFVDGDGNYVIRFNPRLEEGVKNRYLKVKALPANLQGERGESVYSSTVSFEAYTLSFSARSTNSIETDYGGLVYDADKYYFFSSQSAYDSKTNQEYVKSLTGAFPEGRQVVVQRYSKYTTDYNYALQSWTTNTYAENSNVIEETLPKGGQKPSGGATGITDDFYRYSNFNSDFVGSYSDYLNDVLTKDVIPIARSQDPNLYTSIDAKYNETQKMMHYPSNELTKPLSSYVYDHIYEVKEENVSTHQLERVAVISEIVVTSHAKLHTTKFYANWAKVRGFVVSGTFFAGDNFFTGADQHLKFVDVSVFNNGEFITALRPNNDTSYSIKDDFSDIGQQYRTQPIKIEQNGSYFSVSGLEWNDYVYFEKMDNATMGEGTATVSSLMPFNFHSPLMDKNIVYSVEKKVMSLKATETLYSDRQDIAIIGTQYNEDTNLVVNLYQTTDKGSANEIEGLGIMPLQEGLVDYEIIKSISTYEDEFGYIQTNVIISILLPSNAVLVGYNMETLNFAPTLYYTTANGKVYVASQNYSQSDADISLDLDSFFKVDNQPLTSGNVHVNQNSTALIYENGGDTEVFLFSHKAGVKSDASGANGGTIYYYNSTKVENEGKYTVIARKIPNSGPESFYLLTYTKVDESAISVETPSSSTSDGTKVDVQIKINGEVLTQQSSVIDDLLLSEANEVSAVVTAYATEMRQTNPKDDTESQEVYVYYDVKARGNKFYYISPVAKKQFIQKTDSSGNITFDEIDNLYFKQISNFDDLVNNKKSIMLGSDILTATSGDAYIYREIMGARLVSSCYYYIRPLGEAIELYVKQYITDENTEDQTKVVNKYTYKTSDGSSHEFNGTIMSSGEVIGTLIQSDVNGVVDSKFDNVKDDNILYDSTGRVSYDVGASLKPSNYFNSHYQDTTTSTWQNVYYSNISMGTQTFSPGAKKLGTDFLIRVSYTLYATTLDGNKRSMQLIGVNDGSGMRYYEYSASIDESVYYTFELVGPNSNSFRDRVSVVSYTKHNVSGGSDTKTTTKVEYTPSERGGTKTGYCAFLIPTYYAIRPEDGEKVGSEENSITYLKKENATEFPLYLKESYGAESKTIVSNTFSFDATTYVAVPSFTIDESSGKAWYSEGVPVCDNGYLVDPSSTPGNIRYVVDPSTKSRIRVENNGNLQGTSTPATFTLYYEQTTVTIPNFESSLVRSANKKTNTGVSVTLLGKYIETNDVDSPVIYPGFSIYDVYGEDEAYILASHDQKFNQYYSLDYTSKNLVIEGFPGVSLLAGPPYPNQVLYFSIRHKADEAAIVNLCFDIKNAFYVEVLGEAIEKEDDINIYDFNTYAFKDTLVNLELNDYMDKSFWVLDRTTLKPVVAYIKDKSTGKFIKVSDTLSLQEVAIDDTIAGHRIYLKDYVSSNGKYIYELYRFVGNPDSEEELNDAGLYELLDYEKDVYVWSSSSTALEEVRTYDIHSYYQGLDGTLYLNSGIDTDVNIKCYGMENFNYDAQFSENSMFNYDEVLFSGVTYAYRTKASQVIDEATNNLYGYWLDRGLGLLDAYDSHDAYFLSGREAAVFFASPVVTLSDDGGHNYIYRFKEWKIYQRRNSEVIFYNPNVISTLENDSLTNAILRFTSNEAGYYVIMPVYQRVYSIDIGTAVLDGALNQGGSIDVMYDIGSASADVDNRDERDLYIYEYLKTNYGGREGYYYGDIDGSAFLYFTGEFKNETEIVGSSAAYPVFEVRDDIFAIRFHQKYDTFETGNLTLYFQVKYNATKTRITAIRPVDVIQRFEKDKPGVVMLTHVDDAFNYSGNIVNFDGSEYSYGDTTAMQAAYNGQGNYYYKSGRGVVKAEEFNEMISYAFNSYFYYDTVGGDAAQGYKSTPLFYNKGANSLYAFDMSQFDDATKSVTGGLTFLMYLYVWNMHHNNELFPSDSREAFEDLYDDFKNRNDAYDEFNEEFWNIDLDSPGILIDSLRTDHVANIDTRIFTEMTTFEDGVIGGEYRYSVNGSLHDGELVKDKDGNIYSTQQFKSVYIDRDAYVLLEVTPARGYRVEGWYKCLYDADTDTWYTTDEKVENTEYIYSDEVLHGYYNPILRQYFYVTQFCVELDDTGTYIYYSQYDPDKGFINEAIVPDNMLDSVRGYYININENQGTSRRPNYIRVYKNYANNYYFDVGMHQSPVDTDVYTPIEMTHFDAINRDIPSSGEKSYTLSDYPVFRRMETSYDKDGVAVETEHFYRVRETGNVEVKENKLIIHKLHSNVRYVAKFIEIYNQYIFAEEAEDSGIDVLAVYYNNSDPRKADIDTVNEQMVIRTNNLGVNKTSPSRDANGTMGYPGDDQVSKLDEDYMRLYKDETKTARTSSIFSNTYERTVDGIKRTFYAYDNASKDMYAILAQDDGFGSETAIGNGKRATTPTYRVNAEDDEDLDGKLVLNSMYFDIETTVFILVQVKAEADLTIHSLGLNSNYTIEPIFAPTEDFIIYNKTAPQSEKVDYVYYIFRVTYNRDPENEYASYIVHPNRGESMAFDILAGNYLDFYNNYFVTYIVDRETREYSFDEGVDYVLHDDGLSLGLGAGSRTSRFLKQLKDNNVITQSIYDKYNDKDLRFKNISELLDAMNKDMKDPDCLKVGYVTIKPGTYDKDYAGDIDSDKLSKSEDIFAALKAIYKIDESGNVVKNESDIPLRQFKNPYLIWSGQQNFINLSTIPVYTYTVQAVTLDDTSPTINIDANGRAIMQSSSVKQFTLKNSVYASAGINGRTFLGSATEISLTDPFVYFNPTSITDFYGTTAIKFYKRFDNLEYANDNTNTTILPDLPFASNTMVLFSGTEEVDNSDPNADRYEFAGWYEQKYDRDTNKWSPLALMSTSIDIPYMSLATADTVILAVYKKVVNVTMTYNKDEGTVDLNGSLDSLGHALSVEDDGTKVTIKGDFYFDAELPLTIVPNGGYRFDNLTYNDGILFNPALDSSAVYYSEFSDAYPNGVQRSYYSVRLNAMLRMILPIKEALFRSTDTTDVEMNINFKKIVLVYINVENYVYGTGSAYTYTFSGFDFGLYSVHGSTVHEYARTNGRESGSRQFVTNSDSTQNDVVCAVNGTTLYMYGYFDYDISGELVIVTFKDEYCTTSVNEWYINGYTTATNSSSDEGDGSTKNVFDTHIYKDATGKEVNDEFTITFLYDTGDPNIDNYNGGDRFALKESNSVFYMKAEVVTETQDLVITHSFADSIDSAAIAGYPAGTMGYNADVYSMLSYSGDYYQDGSIVSTNGSFVVKNKQVLSFGKDALISIAVNSEYVLIGSGASRRLYVFVGWYRLGFNIQEGVSTAEFIQKNPVLQYRPATGAYEAKYIRAYEVDNTNVNETYGSVSYVTQQHLPNAGITDSTITHTVYGYYDDGHDAFNYALSGATITLQATPNNGYFILEDSLKVEDQNGSPVEFTTTEIDGVRNLSFVATKNVKVYVNFTRGCTVILTQTLYSSINMELDGSTLTNGNYVAITVNGKSMTNYEFVVQDGTVVLFSAINSTIYYFVGFFINGNIVSTVDVNDRVVYGTEYSEEVNSNLIIEARFVPYVTVNVSSVISETNSYISNFMAELSYLDLRTGNNAVYSYSTGMSSFISIPAGTQVTLKETRPDTAESNPYSFVEWSVVDTSNSIVKHISNSKEAVLGVLTDLRQAIDSSRGGYVKIAAIYTSSTVISISKEITATDEDIGTYAYNGVLSDLFKSFFDIKLTYTDIYGAQRSVSLGSKLSVEGILAKRDTSITFEVWISNIVSDRYYVSSLNTTAKSITTNVVNDGLKQTLTFNNASSIDIKAIFLPASFITLSKVLNGTLTDASELDVNYEISSSDTGLVKASGSVSSQAKIQLIRGDVLTITVTTPNGYTYHGIYENGALYSRNDTATIQLVDNKNINYTIVFSSSASLEGEIVVEGAGESVQSGMKFNILGTFIEENDGQVINRFEQIVLDENQTSFSGRRLDTSKRLILVVDNIDGYSFKGFTITVDGVKRTGTVNSNSYGTVCTIIINSGESVHVTASFERVYPINYTVTTLDGEGASTSRGGYLSNQQYSFVKGQSSISFTVNVISGYTLMGVYANGSYVTSSRNVVFNIPNGTTSLDIEVKFVKNVTLSLRVAVAGTSDANEIKNKLGLNPSSFSVNIGGNTRTFSTANSMYLNYSSLQVGNNVTLSIGYNSRTRFTASDGITYVFDGWYVYDGTSVATSDFAVAYNSSMEFNVNGNLSLIAKFVPEDDQNNYTVSTERSYEFFNGTTTTVLSAFAGSVVNQVTSYNGDDYLFIGYYTKLSDSSLGYLKITNSYNANLSKYTGVYPSLIARFVKIVKVTNNFNRVGVVGSYNEVNLAYSADTAYGGLGTSNGTLTTLAGAQVNSTLYAFYGYNISPSTNNIGSVTGDVSNNVQVDKYGIITNVNVVNNVINSNASVSSSTSSASQLNINNIEETARATFSVENGAGSVLYVTILDELGNYKQFEVSEENNDHVEYVKTGSKITLSFDLDKNTEFIEYRIVNNSTYISKDVVYTYYYTTRSSSSLYITARFSTLYTATLVGNDDSKGEVKVERNLSNYVFDIHAHDGFVIDKVYALDINSVTSLDDIPSLGVDLLTASAGEYGALLSSLSIDRNNTTSPASDDLSRTILTSAKITMSLRKDIAIYVTYVPVVKINLQIGDSSTSNMFYYFDSVINLSSLKAFIDYIISQNASFASIYEYGASTFTFEGNIITEDDIDLTGIIEATIHLNRQSEGKVKVYVEGINKTENGQLLYNAPKDGLTVTLGASGLVVGKITGMDAFNYQTALATPIYAQDTNNYYKFIGYYTDSYALGGRLVTESSNYAFTFDDFNPSRSTFSRDTDGNIIIYAVFEEIVKEVVFEASYVSPSFTLSIDGATLTPTANIQTYKAFSTSTNVGYLSYKLDGNKLVISYPLSLCDASATFKVTAVDFSLSSDTTDPLLEIVGVDRFYEKTISAGTGNKINDVYLRFKQYTNANGEILGSIYNPEVEINLRNMLSGDVITASAVNLYLIEFAYNKNDVFEIVLSLTRISSDGATQSVEYIPIASSSNYHTFNNALISYKAEEGTSITARIDLNDYTGGSVLLLGSDEVMLSDLFAGRTFGDNNLPTDDAKAGGDVRQWWADALDGKFSPIIQVFNHLVERGDLTSISFTASKNLSILADCFNCVSFNRRYPVAVLYTPGTLDSSHGDDASISIRSSSRDNKKGDGFTLDFTEENTTVKVNLKQGQSTSSYTSRFYTDRGTYNTSSGQNDINIAFSTFYSAMVDASTKGIFGEMTFRFVIVPKLTLVASSRRLRKEYVEQDDPSGDSNTDLENYIKNAFPEITDNRFTKDNIYYAKYDSTGESLVTSYAKLEENLSFKAGEKISLRAEIPEGYYFQGFVIADSLYHTTLNILEFGGAKMNSSLSTYTVLRASRYEIIDSKRYAFADLQLYGSVEIYAHYEARPYIVTIKSYEFIDDAEHPDIFNEADRSKSKMTTNEVVSSKFKGSLLIQQGVDGKIQNINFPYIQLAGWATSKEYINSFDEDDRFKAFATAEDQPTSAFTSDARPLKYDELSPNIMSFYNEETKEMDGFPITAMSSYIYLYNVYNDVELCVYYAALSYEITINLAEILGVHVYADSNYGFGDLNNNQVSESISDSYLTYADYIRMSPGWKNPSAGTYEYATTLASNDRNGATTTTKVEIKENDPYVYVMNDYKGNSIIGTGENGDTSYAYPTRVPRSLVSPLYSKQNGKLTYVINKSSSADAVVLNIITETNYKNPSGASNYLNYPYSGNWSNNDEGLMAFYKTTDMSQIKRSTDRSGVDQLYTSGFDSNQYEMNGSTPKLDNIYNYIEFADTGIRLMEGLFTVRIHGETENKEFDSSNIPRIVIDPNTGVVQIKIKVTATSSGFPSVRITQNEGRGGTALTDGAIIPMGIAPEGYIPTTQSDKQFNSTDFTGFHLGLYDNVDLSNPDLDLGNLDVTVVIKWEKLAMAIDSEVSISTGRKTQHIKLSGNGRSSVSSIEDITASVCKNKNAQSDVHEHDEEIQAYYVAVIQNGQYLINILEWLSEHDTNESIRAAAGYAQIYLLSLAAGDSGERGEVYNVANTGNVGTSASINFNAKFVKASDEEEKSNSGNLLDWDGDETARAIANLNIDLFKIFYGLLSEYYSCIPVGNWSNTSKVITVLVQRYMQLKGVNWVEAVGGYDNAKEQITNFFRVKYIVNTFAYYKKGIAPTMYGDFANADDLVISECVLQEHSAPQINTSYLFGNKKLPVWTANKGYDYVRHATMNAKLSKMGTALTSVYDNNPENVNRAPERDVHWTKDVRNFVVGMFNGREKYAGTYVRLLHVSFTPPTSDFKKGTTAISSVDIHHDDGPIMTAILDYAPIPLADALVVALSAVLAAMITGMTLGASAVLIAATVICIVDCIVQMVTDDSTLFTVLTNINF